MNIVIYVKKHYDWVPLNEKPADADILALKAKPSQDGKWLKKVVKDKETFTEINLPEEEIKNCMEHFERTGIPKTRPQTVLWYITEKVMAHHAHPEDFTKIEVHKEPEVEAYLNKYFDLTTEVKPEIKPVVAS